ncbi:MAG: hypothetical protein JJU20_00360 [Opitutales bacterium]|nr:hypothetical protein [Opitutales bacterium]
MNKAVKLNLVTGRMLRYLRSWGQEDGSFNGFHTHPVWRLHPGILEDHYSGYAAWGAPYLIGLAELVRRSDSKSYLEYAVKLCEYALTHQQEDSKWDFCGAEFGRAFNRSTICNMLQNLSLCRLVSTIPDKLDSAFKDRICQAVLRNLESYNVTLDSIESKGHAFVVTANQDCAAAWAIFEWMEAFGHDERWMEIASALLDKRLQNTLVMGVPDATSAAMLREAGQPDYIEPAEYYGVIIPPFWQAYRKTGKKEYLEACRSLANHVVRSSWLDSEGLRRVHRCYDRVDGQWQASREPMLVAGMGLLALSFHEMRTQSGFEFIDVFLTEMNQTYAAHQHPYGFLTPATGWHDEYDILCGTTWQVHDFAYLMHVAPDVEQVLKESHENGPDLAVLLGYNDAWVESDDEWAWLPPASYGFGIAAAKKDRYGYPCLPKFCDPPYPARHLNPPVRLRLVDGVFHIEAPDYASIAVRSIYRRPYVLNGKHYSH